MCVRIPVRVSMCAMLGLWFGRRWRRFIGDIPFDASESTQCAILFQSTVSQRSIFVIVTISTVWNKVFFYIHQLAILRHSNIWLNQFLFVTMFALFIPFYPISPSICCFCFLCFYKIQQSRIHIDPISYNGHKCKLEYTKGFLPPCFITFSGV